MSVIMSIDPRYANSFQQALAANGYRAKEITPSQAISFGAKLKLGLGPVKVIEVETTPDEVKQFLTETGPAAVQGVRNTAAAIQDWVNELWAEGEEIDLE